MNVLVTGGAGYIGSHTVVELIQAGHLKMLHTQEYINLDCACGYDMPMKSLACLRLDDLTEFYS